METLRSAKPPCAGSIPARASKYQSKFYGASHEAIFLFSFSPDIGSQNGTSFLLIHLGVVSPPHHSHSSPGADVQDDSEVNTGHLMMQAFGHTVYVSSPGAGHSTVTSQTVPSRGESMYKVA